MELKRTTRKTRALVSLYRSAAINFPGGQTRAGRA